MNKLIILAAATLALSACTELSQLQSSSPTLSTPETISDVAPKIVDEKTEVAADATTLVADANAAGGQCLTTQALTNDTFKVIPKGTKGTVLTEKGKTYFVVGNAKNDLTGVPIKLAAC